MKKIILKLKKLFALGSFQNGLAKCNKLGKELTQKPVDRFLDLGCGDGKLTLEFAKIAKAKEIWGIEFADSLRKKAQRKGIKCLKNDLNKKWKLKSNYFDLILSSQNIEHMYNTRLYLEECYRCLRPGGQLIILTENLAAWINIGALVFGWQPFSTTYMDGRSLGNPLIWHHGRAESKEWEKSGKKLHASGITGMVSHIRVLAYQGLKDSLKKANFKKVKVYTKGWIPLWGIVADLFCFIDKRHGHFLIATGQK